GDTWPWKEAWGRVPEPTPAPVASCSIGLHDEPGGRWMVDNGLMGCCLVHAVVQRDPVGLDYRHLSDKGIRVILRLNWGYVGPGTLPPAEHAGAWVAAMIETINNANGVWGVIIGNEVNNPIEWTGAYPSPSFIVTPDYYIGLYNNIRAGVSARLAPFSVDPYNVVAREFGQPGDPKTWAQAVYAGISGFDFISLHAKTQTNDPTECWSEARFSDAPLTGRYLHLRTVQDQLSWVDLGTRPAFVTELNPQLRSDGALGWDPGNGEWVRQAVAYLKTQPIAGALFYRFELAGDQAGFGLANKPENLEAIRWA
ncbi:MAG: hypothetical protein R6U87_00120, partial [Thiohalospira sp.]